MLGLSSPYVQLFSLFLCLKKLGWDLFVHKIILPLQLQIKLSSFAVFASSLNILSLIPPVTCLVSDCYMPFTIQVAEENALPILLFSPTSACNFLTTFHFRTLFDKGLIPSSKVIICDNSLS